MAVQAAKGKEGIRAALPNAERPTPKGEICEVCEDFDGLQCGGPQRGGEDWSFQTGHWVLGNWGAVSKVRTNFVAAREEFEK
jgi:hypothetical protein